MYKTTIPLPSFSLTPIFMAKESSNITPDRVAIVCDKIATIDDPGKRATRVSQAAEQYGVSEEVINATFAHVKIRRERAVQAVRALVNEKKRTLDLALEGIGHMDGRGAKKMAGHLEERERTLALLHDGFALLQHAETEQQVLAAIEKFAEAEDPAVLEVIADVYGPKRPDIAVEALLRAGTPDAALALAVQHQRAGNRSTFNKLLGRVMEELA